MRYRLRHKLAATASWRGPAAGPAVVPSQCFAGCQEIAAGGRRLPPHAVGHNARITTCGPPFLPSGVQILLACLYRRHRLVLNEPEEPWARFPLARPKVRTLFGSGWQEGDVRGCGVARCPAGLQHSALFASPLRSMACPRASRWRRRRTRSDDSRFSQAVAATWLGHTSGLHTAPPRGLGRRRSFPLSLWRSFRKLPRRASLLMVLSYLLRTI